MNQTSIQEVGSEQIAAGMLAGAGAFFCFTLMNVFAKYLGTNHSAIEIAFYRNLLASAPFFVGIFVFGRRELLIIQSRPRVIGLRALLGSVSLVLTFAAYSLMPMAETAILLFTSSLFVPILGAFFLREYVGPYRWSAVIVGFIGVAIMVRPTGEVSTMGIIIALLAALMQAVLAILLRHLGGHERPETVSLYFFVLGTFMTGMVMPFVATAPTLREIPLLFGVGLSGAAAQWLYATALKNTPAALVAVLNYSSLVWAMVFGWLIWNDWPLPIVLTGSAIVVASNVLIVWRENWLYKAAARRIQTP